MPSLRSLAAVTFAAVACSSVETGIPGGSAGSGPGVDAGSSLDAGTAGGPVDAGTPVGGASDAGSGGSGTSDGGNGSGGTVSDCNGLAPGTLGTMVSYAGSYDSRVGICGLPAGNGHGVIAHLVNNERAPAFTLVNPSGGVNGYLSQVGGSVFPLPNGFLQWGSRSTSNFNSQFIGAVEDSGRPLGTSRAPSGATFDMYSPIEESVALDVGGGAAFAGTIHVEGQPDQRRVMVFDANGVRWGPRALLDRRVFGLGVDLNSRVLVIQNGYAQCSGCILGQWFERDGTPLTGSFTLLAGFSPGPATWFETAPLIGGGLAVRRMDADHSTQTQGFHSQWLITVESGSDQIHEAPDWMKGRPDTDLALARGGAAYAVLSNGAFGAPCTQDVELLSASGNSCARWTLELTSGTTCDTLELRLGLDGTILQRLPPALESVRDSIGRTRTCTVRFWPAALK